MSKTKLPLVESNVDIRYFATQPLNVLFSDPSRPSEVNQKHGLYQNTNTLVRQCPVGW